MHRKRSITGKNVLRFLPNKGETITKQITFNDLKSMGKKDKLIHMVTFRIDNIYCSISQWRPQKVDKRMVLEYTHGLFIT
jgi:hypothetical protein